MTETERSFDTLTQRNTLPSLDLALILTLRQLRRLMKRKSMTLNLNKIQVKTAKKLSFFCRSTIYSQSFHTEVPAEEMSMETNTFSEVCLDENEKLKNHFLSYSPLTILKE